MTGLRERRLAVGLSQEGLARRLGVSRVAVSLFERGKCRPSAQTTDRLEAALRQAERDHDDEKAREIAAAVDYAVERFPHAVAARLIAADLESP